MPVPAVGGSMNSIYKMRGRMPGGAGMPESTFKAFDSQSFGRFQRKNKKVTEFLLEGKSNPRYELMMKMVRIWGLQKSLDANYFWSKWTVHGETVHFQIRVVHFGPDLKSMSR